MTLDRRTLCLAGLAAFVLPPLTLAQDGTPKGLIETFATKGITDILGAQITQKEKTDRFRILFTEFFDIPSIGRFVLGRFARNLSPEDMTRFQALFQDVIVYTWTRRFGEYDGQTLKVSDSVPDGDDGAIVNSAIIGKDKQSFAVAWRTRKRQTGHQIVDVIIEGVSMAITYRNEYSSVIQKGAGIGGLTAQLQKQVDDLKRQLG